MKDLPRRTFTAIVFGAVMLGGILWNRISFDSLLFVINAGCLFEYLRLVRKFQHYSSQQAATAFWFTMIFGCALHVAGFVLSNDPFVFLVAVLIVPMILALFLLEFFMNSETKWKNAFLNSGGIIYVSLFLFCFYALTSPPLMIQYAKWYPKYAVFPLGIILLIWANDTFAYFTGSLIGKHKIAPTISPKKSWEGFFGGLIFSVLTGWILSRFYFDINLPDWIALSIIVSVFGTLGDFFESWIKRKAEVKDSGNLLPGHGGFLDRFDALIFCLPFVTIYLNPFGF